MGDIDKGYQPSLLEVLVRISVMVQPSASPFASVPSSQDAAQSHAQPTVYFGTDRSHSPLEVIPPPPRHPINGCGDGGHTLARVARRVLSDRFLEFL